METIPWLEYEGQTTQQLLACDSTHRIDSLLCAFELAIQAKEAGGDELTAEEKLVLAVEALQREVNNGGFHQFFTNSSHQYAPMIVESLDRIGAREAAELAGTALGVLRLAKVTAEAVQEAADMAIIADDQELLETLDSCDQRFYGIRDVEERLLAFVRANAARIRV